MVIDEPDFSFSKCISFDICQYSFEVLSPVHFVYDHSKAANDYFNWKKEIHLFYITELTCKWKFEVNKIEEGGWVKLILDVFIGEAALIVMLYGRWCFECFTYFISVLLDNKDSLGKENIIFVRWLLLLSQFNR